MAERWRTGRRNFRAIYRQVGPEPSDADECVGLLDTPEIARMFVDAVNAQGRIHHSVRCMCRLCKDVREVGESG